MSLKNDQVETMKNERDKARLDLQEMKGDYNMKATQIKLIEMELEEKMGAAQDMEDELKQRIEELEREA